MSFKLRPYQEASIESSLKQPTDHIIVLPTGAGKSVVISSLVQYYKELDMPVVVAVRTSALIPQLESTLTSSGLTVGVVKAGYEYEQGCDVVLVMEQTFRHRHGDLNIPCSILIRDEYHIGAKGEEYGLLREVLQPERIIGLTATPIDEQGMFIDNMLQMVEEVDTAGLIEQGYLTPPTYITPRKSELMDYSKVKTNSRGDYSTSGLDLLLNTPSHNQFVVEQTIKHAISNNRKCMVFANSIEHVEALSQAFTDAGVPNVRTHSKMTTEASQEAIQAYTNNDVRVIINMSQLTTGVDIPDTDCVVLVRPTQVLRLYLQIAGRGLRLFEGKRDALILDLAKCVSTHGFVEGKRNWLLYTKEDVIKEFNEHTLDELVDLPDEQPTKEKVLQYRLTQKTERVDGLLQDNELLTAENKRLEGDNEELQKKLDNAIAKLAQLATNNATAPVQDEIAVFMDKVRKHCGKQLTEQYYQILEQRIRNSPISHVLQSVKTRANNLHTQGKGLGSLVNFITYIENQA